MNNNCSGCVFFQSTGGGGTVAKQGKYCGSVELVISGHNSVEMQEGVQCVYIRCLGREPLMTFWWLDHHVAAGWGHGWECFDSS